MKQFKVPILRGVLHMIMAIVLPTTVSILSWTARDHVRLVTAALIFEVQLIASSHLHLNWNSTCPATRKCAQKIDHLMIPTCTALIGWVFQADMQLIIAAAVVNCAIKIADQGNDFTRLNKVAITVEVAVVIIQTFRSQTESIDLFIIAAINLVTGMLMYALEWPLHDNKVFGYHEIAHVLVGITISITIWVAAQ